MVNSFLLDFFSTKFLFQQNIFWRDHRWFIIIHCKFAKDHYCDTTFLLSIPLSLTGQKMYTCEDLDCISVFYICFYSIPHTDASSTIRKKDFMSSILLMFSVSNFCIQDWISFWGHFCTTFRYQAVQNIIPYGRLSQAFLYENIDMNFAFVFLILILYFFCIF